MSGRHAVGQILYVISKKERKVYPVLVVEEIVRKTLSGEVTAYTVRLPDKKGSTFPLEAVSDAPFSSPAAVRDFLITSATESINSMVNDAEEIARALAPAGVEPADTLEEVESAAEAVYVDMPDGTRARLLV